MLETREMVVIDLIVLVVGGVLLLIFGIDALKYLACIVVVLLGALCGIAFWQMPSKNRMELKCESEEKALHKV